MLAPLIVTLLFLVLNGQLLLGEVRTAALCMRYDCFFGCYTIRELVAVLGGGHSVKPI